MTDEELLDFDARAANANPFCCIENLDLTRVVIPALIAEARRLRGQSPDALRAALRAALALLESQTACLVCGCSLYAPASGYCVDGRCVTSDDENYSVEAYRDTADARHEAVQGAARAALDAVPEPDPRDAEIVRLRETIASCLAVVRGRRLVCEATAEDPDVARNLHRRNAEMRASCEAQVIEGLMLLLPEVKP